MPLSSSDRKGVLLCLETTVKPNSFEDGARSGADCRQRGSWGQQLPDTTISEGPSSPTSYPSSMPAVKDTNMDGPHPLELFLPASFDFTPVHYFWLSILTVVTPPAFPLTSHRLKPAPSAKPSNSRLFFSTVFSPFDLSLFKLYSVMFYTIIDNKIALEPFLTVLFIFFFLT